MKKIVLSVTALALGCLPLVAVADVRVIQDSCQTRGEFPIVYFSVENPAPSLPVCSMTLFPSNNSGCFIGQCVVPSGWSCYPGDVTTFFFADTSPDGCFAAGTTRGGFSAELFVGFCCMSANFFAPDGSHLGSNEVCFDCHGVGVGPETWSQVKRLFK